MWLSSLLAIKVLVRLSVGQTTKIVANLLKMTHLDWAISDYKTPC